MLLQIALGRVEVGERRLRLHELQVHQPAGGVVDEDEQGALRAAILEPPVLRAVDLDQLTDALPAIARLVDPSAALHPIRPNAGVEHPEPQRLAADDDTVDLAQLLGGQRRAEIGVLRADQLQHLVLEAGRHLTVTRPTALLGDQRCSAVLLVGLGQALDLATLQTEQIRCCRVGEASATKIAEDLQPRQLLVAHEMQRHSGGPPTQNEGGCHL